MRRYFAKARRYRWVGIVLIVVLIGGACAAGRVIGYRGFGLDFSTSSASLTPKIGRASCRERV